MTKLEFSDFYKFLSSLGAVLLSLSLLLPWLFLREPFDASISAVDLSNLTLTAQALINSRQATALWIFQNIAWIAGALGCLGVALLSSGLVFWYRKQGFLDQREQLETEKLKREVEKMTPEQVAEKVILEAEVIAEEEIKATTSEGRQPKPTTKSIISDYFRIEEMVLSRLVLCFGRENVLANHRIGRTEYDAIVLATDPKLVDAIFEIKLVNSVTNASRRARDIREVLSYSVMTYKAATKREAFGVGLVVVSDSGITSFEMERTRQSLQKGLKDNANLTIHVVSEAELLGLDCQGVKEIVHQALAEKRANIS